MTKNGAFLVLFKNEKRNQVFLVRRDNYYIWVIPGGGIEKGERPKETALRETKEETDFEVKIVRFLGVYQILDKKGRRQRKTYLYEGRVLSGRFKPEFPGCLGKWFYFDKLPLNMTKATRMKINDAKNYQGKALFRKERREDKTRENLHLLFLNPIGALKYFFKKWAF